MIRQKGLNYQGLLLVGNRYTLPMPIETIQKNPSLGQRILAVLSIDEDMPEQKFMGHKVFHGLRSLKKLLLKNGGVSKINHCALIIMI
jgi:hypothetical protein